MTIDEAIKNLTKWHKDLQHDKLPDYHDSLGLGIEALKLIQMMLIYGDYPKDYPLPGET